MPRCPSAKKSRTGGWTRAYSSDGGADRRVRHTGFSTLSASLLVSLSCRWQNRAYLSDFAAIGTVSPFQSRISMNRRRAGRRRREPAVAGRAGRAPEDVLAGQDGPRRRCRPGRLPPPRPPPGPADRLTGMRDGLAWTGAHHHTPSSAVPGMLGGISLTLARGMETDEFLIDLGADLDTPGPSVPVVSGRCAGAGDVPASAGRRAAAGCSTAGRVRRARWRRR